MQQRWVTRGYILFTLSSKLGQSGNKEQCNQDNDCQQHCHWQISLVSFQPNILGKFSADEEKEWPVTFGFNAKGVMDNEHFKEYFKTNIAPLYPDADDKAG